MGNDANHPGTTWSGTYRYRAQALHRPRSRDELQALVMARRGLHVLGSRHSFNDVADAHELISLDGLPDELSIDSARRTATVPAAMRYRDLALALDRAGWALGNLASLPHISVAGSVATATHGSGDHNPSLAAAVRGLTLVTGSGEVISLDSSAPELAGAVVSLGALGAVVDVTLAIEPSYRVRQDVYVGLAWDALAEQFDDVTSSGYSVSVLTNFAREQADLLWVKTRLTGDESGSMPPVLFGAAAATEKLHLTPGVDPVHCTPQLGEPGPWYDRLPHFLMQFTPSSGAEIQSEYLMRREHAPAAIGALRRIGAEIGPTIKSAEIRTVAADQQWLSSAYQADVFGVHFTWQPDQQQVERCIGLVEDALAPCDPRPHWGKVFGTGFDWGSLYPRLADFRALAARWDPQGVFRTGLAARTVLA